MSEASSNTFMLLDEDPNVFKILVRWFYFQDLSEDFNDYGASFHIGEEPASDDDDEEVEDDTEISDRHAAEMEDTLRLARLWILADKRRLLCLQNAFIRSLVPRLIRYLHSTVMRYVYDHTLPNAKLRALIVEAYSRAGVSVMQPRLKQYSPSILHSEFLADLCANLYGKQEPGFRTYYLDPEPFYVDEII